MLAATALLAGCTADADPQPTADPTTASAAPSPTAAEGPEAEKPVPPDAMRRDDVAGAEAAAQYFLQLYPYVYATGDLTEWKAMSHPECVFCAGVVESVAALYGSGGHAVGGEMSVEKIVSRPPREGNDYFRVDIRAREAPSKSFAGTSLVDEHQGGVNVIVFAVGRDGDGWRIREGQVEDETFSK
ncbi:hypothetical protein GB882_12205 [Georgenia ruanii]|uniref:DUF6318 domain-containing protein n=2 Tax=Georgenia ruanii TaxID=348442 RepID=A0A7J9UY90_9MICO|nr:hypothetical protein [Georgenia ruanii]